MIERSLRRRYQRETAARPKISDTLGGEGILAAGVDDDDTRLRLRDLERVDQLGQPDGFALDELAVAGAR